MARWLRGKRKQCPQMHAESLMSALAARQFSRQNRRIVVYSVPMVVSNVHPCRKSIHANNMKTRMKELRATYDLTQEDLGKKVESEEKQSY